MKSIPVTFYNILITILFKECSKTFMDAKKKRKENSNVLYDVLYDFLKLFYLNSK